MKESRLILGLDGLSLEGAVELVRRVKNRIWAVKIHNLFDEHGERANREVREAGAPLVWDDLKLHDIPGTVGARAAAIKKCGADIVTVHASGGVDMMKAAVDSGLTVFAVTVLTSLGYDQAKYIYGKSPAKAVKDLADMAKLAGVHGIVCSAEEVGDLSSLAATNEMELVVPGTRSPGKDKGDQKRSTTPGEAVSAGATKLVIASEVTKASDPEAALENIERQIT